MRCAACGHTSEPGANFCSRCGAPLGGPDTDTTSIFAPVDLERDDEASVADLEPGQAMLVVLRGPEAGTKFVIDAFTVSLGRQTDSDIFLNDHSVSRRHAEIHRTEEGFEVIDVGSLNGTYVNLKRLERSALSSGDELMIGKFRLLFLASQRKANR